MSVCVQGHCHRYTSPIILLVSVLCTLHSYRCFSFGIGSGASTHLVRGIAEAGRGTAEFVTSGERMQPKVSLVGHGYVNNNTLHRVNRAVSSHYLWFPWLRM